MKPSPRAIRMLRSLVWAQAAVDEARFDGVLTLATERRCRKGEALLRAGEQARTTGIVIDGAFGEFYESATGSRKAKWLAGPGDVFGSLEDLVRVGPARASIEALTDGVLLQLPYAGLRDLAFGDITWARFFMSMLEGLYRRKSEREYTLLMLKAKDRYRWFHEQHGALEQELPQEVIASYLGITPVHLSRVRNAAKTRPTATR